jgi:hypothetical protein
VQHWKQRRVHEQGLRLSDHLGEDLPSQGLQVLQGAASSVAAEWGGGRGLVGLREESYTPDYARAEHTDVHDSGIRLIELLQDVVVVVLNVTLLAMAFVFLYRAWREITAF